MANLSAFAKVIVEHEYQDFGNGFRKPKFPDDVFVYFFGIWVFVTLPKVTIFNIKWAFRRAKKLSYNEEEREWLAKTAVGSNRWLLLDDDERKNCVERGVWEKEELDKFNYEQDVKVYGQKKAKIMRDVQGEEYEDE